MAKISDLSNELLFNIVSHLDTGDESDVATLSRLCRTSHRFLDIAQPALYESIVIKESSCLFSVYLLRRTLMQRPSLGEKTTKLTLFYNDGVYDEWKDHGLDVALEEHMRSVGYVCDELSGEDGYAVVAFEVLCHLPNLQHLCFTTTCDEPTALFGGLEDREYFGCDFLPKLKTFHLHSKYIDEPWGISRYAPFLDYPSFEKISTQTDVPDVPGQYSAINTVTNTAIELFWCVAEHRCMKELVNACRHLNSFKLVIPEVSRYYYKTEGSATTICPKYLHEMLLERHGKNLQTFDVDFRNSYDLHDPEFRREMEAWRDEGLFMYPSFRDFMHLSQMKIEFEKLETLQHLPKSLEHLELLYCHFEDLDRAFLADLVRLSGTWCPAIKSVTINGWKNDQGMAAIREHAESLDVSVGASEDGRVLDILGVGYRLVIQALGKDEYVL